ncbi:MAG: hypothetical protein B7O98_07105 [Zestosphaera tikiterensis]|uniref:Solute-binding protein family 5 domain-containing protein n=1 Tax=Zestosphaera tikiterensis TaxID=1973259 RepID=A0A2R7Y4D7_9CREN|nr:MAG: hypothetical protein B7O98_07105 [Zestosphaera tikiterensis]
MNRMKNLVTFIALALILASIVVGYGSITVAAQQKKGGASDSITYVAIALDKVVEEFKAGRIDAYIYAVRPTQVDPLKELPNVKFVTAPAGMVDIILNPVPVRTIELDGDQRGKYLPALVGYPENVITQVWYDPEKNKTYVDIAADGQRINPLALKGVRLAINYLVDRDFIVKNIYRGFAAPMYTFLSSYDPDYAIVADILAQYGFKYDPDYAKQIITQEMTKAGAVLVGGKWYYGGKPVEITFIIRIEDERKDIGDLIATELERVGFTVNRMYLPFAEALGKVYDSDPADLLWHIYTEGWGKSALEKYDYGAINQYCAPWFGDMPGWQTEGWWWYRNDVIDDAGQKIYFGKFKSEAERNELYRTVTKLCIDDSVRIWIATRMDIYPVSASLQGITQDLGAGMRSPFNLKGVYVPGKPDIVFGHVWVYTARTIWNVYGGFSDVYSVDIERATYDPMTWRDPFNGLPIAVRTSYEVVTAGPDGTLDVPSDAIIWDATQGKWVNVGPGTKAISVVKFDMSKFVGTKWHHGITITWADILATWATWFDLVYNGTKASWDTYVSTPNKAFFDTIKGLRIDTTKNVLEVYVDYWHFSDAYIADYATLTPINPAELLLIENHLVYDLNKYTFSPTAATARKVPALNPVPFTDHANDIKSVADAWRTAGYLPSRYFTLPDGRNLMPAAEWTSRLQALSTWINDHKHAWISQGPYYLDTFDKDNQKAVIKAFRDPTYPFTADYWVKGAVVAPKMVVAETPRLIVGNATSIPITVSGKGPFTVYFLVKEIATNTIVLTGKGTQVAENKFVVEIPPEKTSLFKPYYAYEIQIIATSESVAVPDVTSIKIEALPASTVQYQQYIEKQLEEQRAYLEQQLGAIGQTLGAALQETSSNIMKYIDSKVDPLSKAVSDTKSRVDAISGTLSALQADISDMKTSTEGSLGNISTYVTAVLALSIINLIVAIALPFLKRK